MADGADDAPTDVPVSQYSLDRLVFFSDAVMAIALTLLALDLPLPAPGLDNDATWHAIRGFVREGYLSFAISFVVIAVFWRTHHGFFQHVRRIDGRLVALTMVFLFAIVVLPYFTRLHGERHIGDQPGTVLYAASVALVGGSLTACVWYARRAGLLAADDDDWQASAMISGLAIPTAGFLLSIPIAFASTTLATWTWLLVPVVTALAIRLAIRVRHRGG